MLGLKKEFESYMVNGPSVFEPLRLYCINLTQTHVCLKVKQAMYTALFIAKRANTALCNSTLTTYTATRANSVQTRSDLFSYSRPRVQFAYACIVAPLSINLNSLM